MVYVSGDGTIYRARSPRSRWKETGDRIASTVQWQLHSLLAVLVIAIAAAMCSVPTVQDLREHRVREDGLWFAPAIDKHRSLGVCAVAEVAVGGKPTWHVGAYGAWVALRGDALFRSVAADDAALLVALIVAGFALHALGLPSRGWLRRHCAASAANFRSGRVWCLVLAALAHEDALHLSMNGLALGRAAPRLAERLGDRPPPRPRARARPSSSTRSSAATRRRAARRASSSPCSPSRPRARRTRRPRSTASRGWRCPRRRRCSAPSRSTRSSGDGAASTSPRISAARPSARGSSGGTPSGAPRARGSSLCSPGGAN